MTVRIIAYRHLALHNCRSHSSKLWGLKVAPLSSYLSLPIYIISLHDLILAISYILPSLYLSPVFACVTLSFLIVYHRVVLHRVVSILWHHPPIGPSRIERAEYLCSTDMLYLAFPQVVPFWYTVNLSISSIINLSHLTILLYHLQGLLLFAWPPFFST